MNKVAVIGAGVMGAGIAAQIANAGTPVILLDRGDIATKFLARGLGPAFMSGQAFDLVEAADSETQLERIAECDWIVEVIVERLDIKQTLYRRIEAVRRPGAAVSSNTSTIPLSQLIDGMPDSFAEAFLITHFFNPPRQMRLLELVPGRADPALVAKVKHFCDVAMGKTPVLCHDTPGFIANRIGAFWMQLGMNAAVDFGLSVEEADAAMGRAAGIPKTGVFGLLDLVGLDLMPHINNSLSASLPPTDALQGVLRDWPLFTKLVETGYTGRKGRGGFYRMDRSGGARTMQALDLQTGDYRPQQTADVTARNLPSLLALPGKVGDYARRVLGGTLAYAASLVPEIADDIFAVDTAMRLGYAWKRGPFEMIDAIGAATFSSLLTEAGIGVPPLAALGRPFYRVQQGSRQQLGPDGGYTDIPREPGVLLLADIKSVGQPLLKNASAALWDLGDGVLCFEFVSKLGALDGAILDLLGQTIDLVADRYKALVIGHDGEHFSAGANLSNFLVSAAAGAWDDIDRLIANGQATFKRLKYAPFPVVAAPCGLALGGGCEIALHADTIQAHAELNIGLVECNVGLIPGWGGNGELLERYRSFGGLANDPLPVVQQVFGQISGAKTSTSAADARDLQFLRPADGVTMNRDRLLADAKARALALVDGHQPPAPPVFSLPGASGRAILASTIDSAATLHTQTVAKALATVLTGDAADPAVPVTEPELLTLERAGFMALIRTESTRARIEHTLTTGKPLRN